MKAFPTSMNEGYPQIIQGGMDLRDWFAGLAMQGELASQDSENHWDSCNVLAHYAYSVADAMMKARNENNE